MAFPMLLFFDTITHEKHDEVNLDLVQFSRPVIIQEIRILPDRSRVAIDLPGGARIGSTHPAEFGLQFFVNNLSLKGACAFQKIGDLNYRAESDILFRPQLLVPTDGVCLRGKYSALTFAVFGDFAKEEHHSPVTPAAPTQQATKKPALLDDSVTKSVSEPVPSGVPKIVLTANTPQLPQNIQPIQAITSSHGGSNIVNPRSSDSSMHHHHHLHQRPGVPQSQGSQPIVPMGTPIQTVTGGVPMPGPGQHFMSSSHSSHHHQQQQPPAHNSSSPQITHQLHPNQVLSEAHPNPPQQHQNVSAPQSVYPHQDGRPNVGGSVPAQAAIQHLSHQAPPGYLSTGPPPATHVGTSFHHPQQQPRDSPMQPPPAGAVQVGNACPSPQAITLHQPQQHQSHHPNIPHQQMASSPSGINTPSSGMSGSPVPAAPQCVSTTLANTLPPQQQQGSNFNFFNPHVPPPLRASGGNCSGAPATSSQQLSHPQAPQLIHNPQRVQLIQTVQAPQTTVQQPQFIPSISQHLPPGVAPQDVPIQPHVQPPPQAIVVSSQSLPVSQPPQPPSSSHSGERHSVSSVTSGSHRSDDRRTSSRDASDRDRRGSGSRSRGRRSRMSRKRDSRRSSRSSRNKRRESVSSSSSSSSSSTSRRRRSRTSSYDRSSAVRDVGRSLERRRSSPEHEHDRTFDVESVSSRGDEIVSEKENTTNDEGSEVSSQEDDPEHENYDYENISEEEFEIDDEAGEIDINDVDFLSNAAAPFNPYTFEVNNLVHFMDPWLSDYEIEKATGSLNYLDDVPESARKLLDFTREYKDEHHGAEWVQILESIPDLLIPGLVYILEKLKNREVLDCLIAWTLEGLDYSAALKQAEVNPVYCLRQIKAGMKLCRALCCSEPEVATQLLDHNVQHKLLDLFVLDIFSTPLKLQVIAALAGTMYYKCGMEAFVTCPPESKKYPKSPYQRFGQIMLTRQNSRVVAAAQPLFRIAHYFEAAKQFANSVDVIDAARPARSTVGDPVEQYLADQSAMESNNADERESLVYKENSPADALIERTRVKSELTNLDESSGGDEAMSTISKQDEPTLVNAVSKEGAIIDAMEPSKYAGPSETTLAALATVHRILKKFTTLLEFPGDMVCLPTTKVPSSTTFDLEVTASAASYATVFEIFKAGDLLEKALLLWSNPVACCHSGVAKELHGLLTTLTESQPGLLFLAAQPNVTNPLMRFLLLSAGEEFGDGGLPEDCPSHQLGISLAFQLRALMYVDELSHYCSSGVVSWEVDNAGVLSSLHALYSLTFAASAGQRAVVNVLTRHDNLSSILPFIELSGGPEWNAKVKKSACAGYAAELLICVLSNSDCVQTLKRFSENLLLISSQEATSKIIEVSRWVEVLRKLPAFNHEAIPYLVDKLKDYAKEEAEVARISSAVVTSLRILKYLIVAPAIPADVDRPEELKYKYCIMRLHEVNANALLLQLLGKWTDTHVYSWMQGMSLNSTRGRLLTSAILPSLSVFRASQAWLIYCRGAAFKDLTAIDPILKLYTVTCTLIPHGGITAEVQKVREECIQILLGYTQPPIELKNEENANEADSFDVLKNSLWTMMLDEIMTFTLKSPFTFIGGLNAFSELLPLPLPVLTKEKLSKDEEHQILATRRLWSAHVMPVLSSLRGIIMQLSPSTYAPIQQGLRRMCLQLSDLAPPIAVAVAEALLDTIFEYAVTKPKPPAEENTSSKADEVGGAAIKPKTESELKNDGASLEETGKDSTKIVDSAGDDKVDSDDAGSISGDQVGGNADPKSTSSTGEANQNGNSKTGNGNVKSSQLPNVNGISVSLGAGQDPLMPGVGEVGLPVGEHLSHVLTFASYMMSHPPIKHATLHLIRGSEKSEENYSLLLPCLLTIFGHVSRQSQHMMCQEYIASIINTLCDEEISLVEADDGANLFQLSNSVPESAQLTQICTALLTHAGNPQHSYASVLPSLRTLVMLSAHDYGLYRIKQGFEAIPKKRLASFMGLEAEPSALLRLMERLQRNFSRDSSDCLSTLSTLVMLVRSLITFPMQDYCTDFAPNTSMRRRSLELDFVRSIMDWKYSKEQNRDHPLMRIQRQLKEVLKEDDSISDLYESVDKLIDLLSDIVTNRTDLELGYPELPSPLELSEVYAQRPVHQITDEVEEDRLNMTFWLPTPILEPEEEDMDQEKVNIDLEELIKKYFPGFDLAAELKEKLSMKRMVDSGRIKRKKPVIINTAKGEKTFAAPMRGRGFNNRGNRGNMGGGRMQDHFRNRPPNTSRPPSMHVDDFLVLEAQADKKDNLGSNQGGRGMRDNMRGNGNRMNAGQMMRTQNDRQFAATYVNPNVRDNRRQAYSRMRQPNPVAMSSIRDRLAGLSSSSSLLVQHQLHRQRGSFGMAGLGTGLHNQARRWSKSFYGDTAQSGSSQQQQTSLAAIREGGSGSGSSSRRNPTSASSSSRRLSPVMHRSRSNSRRRTPPSQDKARF